MPMTQRPRMAKREGLPDLSKPSPPGNLRPTGESWPEDKGQRWRSPLSSAGLHSAGRLSPSVSSHHQHLQGPGPLPAAILCALLRPHFPWVLKTLPDPTPRGAKCTPSSQDSPPRYGSTVLALCVPVPLLPFRTKRSLGQGLCHSCLHRCPAQAQPWALNTFAEWQEGD